MTVCVCVCGIVLSTLYSCVDIVEKGKDMRGEWCVCVVHLGRFLLALLLEGPVECALQLCSEVGASQLAVARTVKVSSVPFRGEHLVE